LESKFPKSTDFHQTFLQFMMFAGQSGGSFPSEFWMAGKLISREMDSIS